jgi:TonB family protein
MNRCFWAVMLVVMSVGCREDKLRVDHIEQPAYPLSARSQNEQGTVVVRVGIGANGKVIYAKGSGAPETLVRAAEENAREWTFGPFPAISVFPVDHTIQYVYKLEGKPLVVAPNPIIKTFLPDRIEIVAVPLVSDYPSLEEYKPIQTTK